MTGSAAATRRADTKLRARHHDPERCAGVGIDFGGTTLKGGVVVCGRVERRATRDTPSGADPSDVLDAVAALVEELDAPPGPVGVTIPGEVDGSGRVWRLPNVDGFRGVAVAEELHRRTGRAVAVENDATAAALGEVLHGHGRTFPSFALLTLGTGVGGGIVIDGDVRRGANGFAGELGHVAIAGGDAAAACVCGQRGCVEAYAGSHALIARHRALGGTAAAVHDIAASARAGEPAARAVFAELAEALGAALTSVQNALDLDAIVLSGGVSAAFPLFEDDLRRALRRRAFAPPLGEVPVVVSQLGADAGVVGAAHLPAARPSV